MLKFTSVLSLFLGAILVSTPATAGLSDILASTEATATEEEVTTSEAETSALVGSVMSQLGLNQNQAEGGLGSLLSFAQSNLSDSDFGTLTDNIPDVSGLLAAAPAINTDSGMSGLLSKAGALGSSLQGSAMLYDAFEKLGISIDLVVPMVNVAKSYLETNGSAGTVDLLMKGMGSVL